MPEHKPAKNRRVRVSYTTILTEHEFKGVADLARTWGLATAKDADLACVKRALYSSGVSGCLAEVKTK